MGAVGARRQHHSHFDEAMDPARDFCLRLRAELVRELERAGGPHVSTVTQHWKSVPLPKMHRPLSSTDRVFGDCLDYLSRLLAPWEPYTLYHCKRVSATAALLAMHLGLCEREVKAVQVAGYLHDIGKVGISREVLNRPAKLDAVTYEEVKKHPEIGARILSAVPWPWDLVPAVRYHHEKWDGSGYPVGLKGNQIPLSAQIVSIADFFDSLTTNRPFRAALCPRTALSMMQGLVGRSFCPELWSMFEAMIEDLIRAVPPADPVNRVDKVEYPDSGAWNVL